MAMATNKPRSTEGSAAARKALGDRLRADREQQCWDKESVGRTLNVSGATVGRAERGHTSLDFLIQYGDELGLVLVWDRKRRRRKGGNMKKLLILLAAMLVPSMVLADPPGDGVDPVVIADHLELAEMPPPSTPIEVIETGRDVWTAFSAGKWALGFGLLLTFIIRLSRFPALGGLLDRIPHRWRVSVPLALSGIASALLYLGGELPLELALIACPLAAGVAIGAHEVTEGLRGKRPGYSRES